MKFDYIVMNPPYGKLHLKFLKLATEMINDNGQVISIQPVRWLQDPLWPIKSKSNASKLKETFENKLEIIKIFKSSNNKDGVDLFNARFNMDLAIFKVSNNTNFKYDKYVDYEMFEIIDKIKTKTKTLNDVLDRDKIDGIRVNLQFITAYVTGEEQYKNKCIWIDGKDEDGFYWCSKKYIKNQYFKPDGTPLPYSIKFETYEEAENFVDYLKNGKIFDAITKWYKSDVNIRFTEIPFMPKYNKKQNFTDICNFLDLSNIEINKLLEYYNNESRLF